MPKIKKILMYGINSQTKTNAFQNFDRLSCSHKGS